MAQNLSEITGNTIVKINGQECMLEGFDFVDIGTLQKEYLKQRRQERYKITLETRELLTKEEFDRDWEIARQDGLKIVLVNDEFDAWLTTPAGISTLFWVLAERQYPQRFTREQILMSFVSGELSEDKSLELLQSLEAIMQRGKS